jgi:hypothetical protein
MKLSGPKTAISSAVVKLRALGIAWLDAGLTLIETELTHSRVTWAQVDLADLLLRLERDRIRGIWYAPRAAGILSPDLCGTVLDGGELQACWPDVRDGIERSTKDFHQQWKEQVLPALLRKK